MTRRFLSAMASVVFVAATVYVAPARHAAGQAPRAGRGAWRPPPRSLLKLQRRMISPDIGYGSRQKTGAGLWLFRQKEMPIASRLVPLAAPSSMPGIPRKMKQKATNAKDTVPARSAAFPHALTSRGRMRIR